MESNREQHLCYNSRSASSSTLNGPFLTMSVMTSYKTSAAAIVVSSALVSYAGATSTMSAAIKLTPSRPRRTVRSSRVDQPPVSGVPVAGATTAQGLESAQIQDRETRAAKVQTYRRDPRYRCQCSGTRAWLCLLDP